MNLSDIALETIDGEQTTFGDQAGRVTLVVNVASKCGYTPQYSGLERVFEKYSDRGLVVLGFPCNQFMMQEPGSSSDIKEFCQLNYSVTFPLFAKCKVNGNNAHPLFSALAQTKDSNGIAGKIQWNFEKFLILDTGEILRFRSKVEPESNEIIRAIEGAL